MLILQQLSLFFHYLFWDLSFFIEVTSQKTLELVNRKCPNKRNYGSTGRISVPRCRQKSNTRIGKWKRKWISMLSTSGTGQRIDIRMKESKKFWRNRESIARNPVERSVVIWRISKWESYWLSNITAEDLIWRKKRETAEIFWWRIRILYKPQKRLVIIDS